MRAVRFTLPADRLPTAWFNALPRLPEPLQPPLHPGTKEPVGPDDLAPLFPMGLIAQEVTTDPWVDIPGEVLDILRLWRPTPLVRAERLERALGTPDEIVDLVERTWDEVNRGGADAFAARRKLLKDVEAAGGGPEAIGFAWRSLTLWSSQPPEIGRAHV